MLDGAEECRLSEKGDTSSTSSLHRFDQHI